MINISPELIRDLDALSRQALQLQISSEVGRQVTSILDLDELLTQVVHLVQSRFGYQVVSVWLLSDQGDCVTLRAGASVIDAEFTRCGACLPLDTPSLIVSVCKTRTFRLANDVRLAPDYLDVLPETRAELALPLQVGQDIIGALDIQCTQVNPFNQGDIIALQIVADQVATAIRNARLYQDAQRERRYLESLVQNSPVAIVTSDINGIITAWNPAAEELFGYTQAEAIGHNLDDLITRTEDSRAEAIIYTQQTTGGTPVHSITRRYRKDGSAVDVEVSGAPVLVEGRRVGAFVLYHDITELQSARQQALEARRVAESHAIKAEAANRAKSAFLAMMSHEIRTPLNAIIGMSSLLLDTPLTSEQQDFARTIRTSGNALLTIINDILDFSKIEAGKMDVASQPFDLLACLEAALELVTADAAEKGLELVCESDPDVPGALVGDVNRLRQVLVNLLSNAVKFTERGEIVVEVGIDGERDRDSDAASLSPLSVCFSVHDTGIGIPHDRLPHLFQSFSQIDVSVARRYGGTGLGLAISKRLVDMMGGQIWVESQVGAGSTFRFTIQAGIAPGARPIYAPPGEQAELAGKRLLIADDNAASLRSLRVQALAWGMQAATAASAPELESLLSQGELFDAVLLDTSLLDQYRAVQAGALPLVLLAPLGWQGQKNGARAVLTKPVKTSQVYSALLHTIAGRVVQAPVPAEAAPEFDSHMGARWPLRILIAEDHPTNQKLAQLLLERLGYRADVAANGLEALRSLRRQHYDVVLMDVQMPEMDGLEATRAICREWPAGQRPRIVALTATAAREDREACFEAGMDDYLGKPIRPAELIGALKRAIAAAPPMEHAKAPSEVLDPEAWQNLQGMLGDGMAAALPQLIDTFLGSAPGLLEKMRKAAEQGQADELRRAAHALKSSSAAFGATTFTALCKEAETKSQAGDLEAAARLVAHIRDEYSQVQAALGAMRNRVQNAGKGKGLGD